jgi:hypothetical protein
LFYPVQLGSIHKPVKNGPPVPHELKSKEEFEKLVESATEVRVSRKGDRAKVKLRTKAGLYTLSTTSEEADSLVKGVKAPVVEF